MPHPDLTRITLAVLFLGALLAASLWIIWPFLPAIVWAATLVVATWPMMLSVQRHTGNRRGFAVLVMSVLLLLVLIIPAWLAISVVVANVDQVPVLVRAAMDMRIPQPPGWLIQIPVIGERIAQGWDKIDAATGRELAPKLTPYAGAITRWFVSTAGSLGGTVLEFLLVVAIAAIMYAKGEQAASFAIRFGHRLADERGAMAVRLAGQAIRAVALGIVVTAVAQTVVGGFALAVTGVPYASLLTAVMFLLCLAQIGPALVLIPAIVWMYHSGDAIWATVLLALSIVAIGMDNFLRPILIRRGADLPLLLIIAGVVGGLIASGLLGLFLGPTVLAVAYTLLQAWVGEDTLIVPAAGEISPAPEVRQDLPAQTPVPDRLRPST